MVVLVILPAMIGQKSIGSARTLYLLVLILTLGLASRSHADAQADPASEEFQLINKYRTSLGLPPFQYNGVLASAAQRHANWMAANVIYSHTGEGGSSPQSRAASAGFYGYVVENIVGGSRMSPNQGLIWWQNSPVHLNTLISTRYYEAGTGFATNGSQNMYVLVVGRPNEGNPPPAIRPSDSGGQPLIITPIELAEPRADGSIVHELQQGQAMWTIAAYYDVALDYLYLINNLTIDDILHPGNEVTVRLAEGQEPPPSPTPPFTYIVREGDSPWAIAGRYEITIDDFFYLNGLNPDSTLRPGDEVVIRLAEGQAPPPTPTPITSHIVREGQSAWTIAALHNLTVEELLELNNLDTSSVLRPGDELTIRRPEPTPPPPPTQAATPAPANTPTPASLSADVVAAVFSPTPIVLQNDIPSAMTQPATTPEAGSGSGSRDAGEAVISWLPIVAVGLALAGGAVLIIARRQH